MSDDPAGLEVAAKPTRLVVLLVVVAALMATMGTAGAVVALVASQAGVASALSGILRAVAFFVAGWSAAALLCALSWLIRRQHEASVVQRKILAALNARARRASTGVTTSSQPHGDQYAQAFEQLLAELKEFNTNMLLTAGQREAKRRHRQWQVAERLAAEAELALNDGQFAQTEELLEQLISAVPDDPRHEQLTQRLAEARAAAEADDIRAQTERADDLMAVGSFDEAQKAAEELLDKHPSAPKAISLLDRVRREREAFISEQRRRLYQEVETHAEARRWSEALAAAKRLLEAYPLSAEAEEVSTIMPTLRDNAEIEQVRGLRDEIRRLVEHKSYASAVVLAERVIREFPHTQAASDLGGQIDRIRELARKEGI